jgi:hypothetical protein
MDSAPSTLLAGLIDYAGLYPPAALPLERALGDYAGFRLGPERRALNRFVVPGRRLEELGERLRALPRALRGGGPWRLAVTAGPELAGDVRAVAEFTARHGPALAWVETLETVARTADEVTRAREAVASGPALVVELPLNADLPALVRAVKAVRALAKVRTGGPQGADIPPPAALLGFLEACARERLPFKATAGLHHPVRGVAPLGYEPGSERATHHGYLNVLLAAAALWHRRSPGEAARLLEDEDRDAFQLRRDEIVWRSLSLTTPVIAGARRSFATAVGSCSFTEPVEELRELGAGIAGLP